MPTERFFDPDLTQTTITNILKGDEFHHATKVLRLKEHEHLELINGKGLLARGKITSLRKKELIYEVIASTQEPLNPPECTLILGMPKFTRLEFIVEKVCELGCDEIILFNADRSEKVDLSKNQLERLELILIAALKQSGRLMMPTLECRPCLEQCLDTAKQLYFGDLHTQTKLPLLINTPAAFVIGPESGFSDKEHLFLKSKATGVKLSKNVLRVDTASISAIALLQDRKYESLIPT